MLIRVATEIALLMHKDASSSVREYRFIYVNRSNRMREDVDMDA
jgi:hypothetical protein